MEGWGDCRLVNNSIIYIDSLDLGAVKEKFEMTVTRIQRLARRSRNGPGIPGPATRDGAPPGPGCDWPPASRLPRPPSELQTASGTQ